MKVCNRTSSACLSGIPEHAVKIMPGYMQAWEHQSTEYQVVGRYAEAQ